MFRRRDRTEALISRIDLGIRCYGLQIGLNDFPDTGLICVAGNFGWRCLALTQRLSQAFKREVETGALLITLARALAVAKQIDDRFCGTVDAHPNALDQIFLDTRGQHLLTEANELEWRLSGP